MGISTRLRVAAVQLAGASRRRVDVGHVTINGRHGRHFLLMAGLGLDGAVIARVSKPLKNRIGPLAVGLAAVQALPSFNAVPVRVELDGLHWQGRVSQIVVGNTRGYGGFTQITADARVDDGLLDVCLITASGLVSAGRQLTSLVVHHRPSPATAETYRAAHVTIQSPVALPLQVDGGAVRLKKDAPTADGMVYSFSTVAEGVCVLVPRTYDGTLFEHASGWATGTVDTRLEAAQRDGVEEAPRGRGKRKSGDKESRRLMRVLAVGVDSLTAVRAGTGRVVTVLFTPSTIIEDVAGAQLPPREALSTLAVGQMLRVKGQKDRDHGTILARHVTVLATRAATGPDVHTEHEDAPSQPGQATDAQ
jgi:hypothetical protein